jgi:hypothetical protein
VIRASTTIRACRLLSGTEARALALSARLLRASPQGGAAEHPTSLSRSRRVPLDESPHSGSIMASSTSSTLSPSNARSAAGSSPLAATCHCGAVRIHVRRMSRSLTSCNCSICRRYGALWAYYAASSVSIEAPKSSFATYSWNRRIRTYYRCKRCGCVTHYAYRKKRRTSTIAVNASNFEPSALAGIRIRHLDGAASWRFLD